MFKCHVCKQQEAALQCPKCGRPVCPNCFSDGQCWECHSKANAQNVRNRPAVTSNTVVPQRIPVATPRYAQKNRGGKRSIKHVISVILIVIGVLMLGYSSYTSSMDSKQTYTDMDTDVTRFLAMPNAEQEAEIKQRELQIRQWSIWNNPGWYVTLAGGMSLMIGSVYLVMLNAEKLKKLSAKKPKEC